jgi:hypothetical protein
VADERWCEVINGKIVNTCIVDPDTDQGQDYLALMEAGGSLMLPEADAVAQYPYRT